MKVSWSATSGDWTEQGEWPVAVGTAGKIFDCQFAICDFVNSSSLRRLGIGNLQQVSGLSEQVTIALTEQAVVTDLDEPIGEDVLEEAADELLSRKGTESDLLSG